MTVYCAPSACAACKRPMRPGGTTVAAYPGTVQHDGRARCTTCASRHQRGLPPLTEPPADTSPLCPCAECGRMTRPPRWPADRAPGTIRRVSRGLCSTCYQHHAEEHDRINADHTAEPESPAPAPLTLAQLDQAVCARRPAHWWDTDHATDGTQQGNKHPKRGFITESFVRNQYITGAVGDGQAQQRGHQYRA